MRPARLGVLATGTALALPAIASACAVCGLFADERGRKALFNATMFMSLLPLVAVGLGLWWVARRAGEALRSEFHESDETAPEPEAPTPRG